MPITDDDIRQIQEGVAPLIGQRPWAVIVAGMHNLIFNFGERISKEGEQDEFGEWMLTICASWRLENSRQILLGSMDSMRNREKVLDVIKNLENLAILSIRILKPSLYTTIEFEQGYFLHLIPVEIDKSCHWELINPDDDTLIVGPGANWSVE